jgi:putative heme-binding domain-containing protein
MEVLAHCGEDRLIPHIVWQNLHLRLEKEHERFVQLMTRDDYAGKPGVARLAPHAVERILSVKQADPAAVADLFVSLLEGERANREAAGRTLWLLAERIRTGEIAGAQLAALKNSLERPLQAIMKRAAGDELAFNAALATAAWGDAEARKLLRSVVLTDDNSQARLAALESLIAGGDNQSLALAVQLLESRKNATSELQAGVLGALGKLSDPRVGVEVAAAYERLSAQQKPKAIELLTQRPAWSKDLLAAIGKGEIPTTALNANQVRKLLDSGDPELTAAVQKHWGTIRTERDPQREEVLAKMREFLRKTPGDPHRGREAFMKVCGQCHKIYGQGQEVGPDITLNGRGNFEQLLSNVFDPSLVIGAAYQAHTVITADGRVLTGLLTEDSPQRVVLKTCGGDARQQTFADARGGRKPASAARVGRPVRLPRA